MTTLLVACDGSEPSLRALRHAMRLADKVHLVNVQPEADYPGLLLHMTKDDIRSAQLEHGRSSLDEAGKLLEQGSLARETHVLIGEPAKMIVGIAKSEGVDGIVMGTRGMGAIGNLVMGSTATKVIHLAEVPVTLVK